MKWLLLFIDIYLYFHLLYISKLININIEKLLLPYIKRNESIYIYCKGGLGNRLLSFNGIMLMSIIRRRKPISMRINLSVKF